MPAHKRSPDGPTDNALLHFFSQQHHRKLDKGVDQEEVPVKVERPRSSSSPSLPPTVAVAVEEQRQECDAAAAAVDKEDSDFSHEAEEELPEYIYVDLQEIRKEVQCPICLGIIKKTRTVMECLHRFCRQCIDKSMRMGNNECPACRTHCASRRSLKDDPRYDAFIEALFPDIHKYEEEESALCEEEKTRNKQIQASIAQILKVQSDTHGTKRSSRKGTRVSNSGTPSRRSKRRRSRKTLLEESDENEELENTEGQTSSISADHSKKVYQNRHKTRRRIGTSSPDSPATSSDMENKLDQKSSHPGIMWNMEMRAWGKGGARSNIRHGSANGLIRKNPPSPHLDNLVEFLQNLEKQDVENVASETPSRADKQLMEATEPPTSHYRQGWLHLSAGADNGSLSEVDHLSAGADNGSLSEVVDHFRDRLQMSEDKKTLAGFQANCISHAGQLILACQQKETL